MKLYHLLSILLVCFFSCSSFADIPERYFPPKNIVSSIKIKTSTNGTVIFRLEVKSVLGTIRKVELSARLSGFNKVIAIPSEAKFEEIKEGESKYLDFVVPITKEKVNSEDIKLRGIIRYIPDYDAAVKYIENNKETEFPNDSMRDALIYEVNYSGDRSLESVETIRYFPKEN